MHSRDRHWRRWLWLLIPVILLCGSIAAMQIVMIVGTLMQGHGLAWADLTGLFIPLYLSIMVWFFLSQYPRADITKSRERERRRRRALAGDLSAMPLARPLGSRIPPEEPVALPLSVLWMSMNGTHGVVATEDALIWRRAYQDEVAIRWSDAQLFEVWRQGKEVLHGYCLYGPRDIFIEWTEYPAAHMLSAAQHVPADEMRRRQQALPRVVMQRTGLRARTAVDALAETPVPPTARAGISVWFNRLVTSAVALAFALVPLVAGILALSLPLTPVPWINLYAAVTLCGAGIAMLWTEASAIVRYIRHRRAQPPTLQIPTLLVPLDQTIEIRTRLPVWQRLLIIGSGLLLLGNSIPFFTALHAGLDRGDSAFVATVLAVASFVGLLASLAGLVPGATAVIAKEAALENDTRTRLTWDAIGSLAAFYKGGRITKFAVIGADITATTIEWPARARWSIAPATDPAWPAPPLTAAAIVAQRTGLSWTVVPEN